MMIDSTHFPILQSQRLLLRESTMEDIAFYFELRSNKEGMKYIPRTLPTSEQDIIPFLENINELYKKEDAINWVICIKETGEPIGSIGFYRTEKESFRTEIGYMLLPKYYKKGYAHEAIQTVLEHGFKVMQFNSICAVIDPRNEASRKVLVKNNFVLEGNFKEDFFFEGVFYDSEYYGMLRRNYLNI